MSGYGEIWCRRVVDEDAGEHVEVFRADATALISAALLEEIASGGAQSARFDEHGVLHLGEAGRGLGVVAYRVGAFIPAHHSHEATRLDDPEHATERTDQ